MNDARGVELGQLDLVRLALVVQREQPARVADEPGVRRVLHRAFGVVELAPLEQRPSRARGRACARARGRACAASDCGSSRGRPSKRTACSIPSPSNQWYWPGRRELRVRPVAHVGSVELARQRADDGEILRFDLALHRREVPLQERALPHRRDSSARPRATREPRRAGAGARAGRARRAAARGGGGSSRVGDLERAALEAEQPHRAGRVGDDERAGAAGVARAPAQVIDPGREVARAEQELLREEAQRELVARAVAHADERRCPRRSRRTGSPRAARARPRRSAKPPASGALRRTARRARQRRAARRPPADAGRRRTRRPRPG